MRIFASCLRSEIAFGLVMILAVPIAQARHRATVYQWSGAQNLRPVKTNQEAQSVKWKVWLLRQAGLRQHFLKVSSNSTANGGSERTTSAHNPPQSNN